jgi:pimeloyl-ACP methyl ester carboxylesterase
VFDGVGGLTTLVERMHETIARRPLPFSAPPEAETRGHGPIAAGVYETIRTVNGWARDGIDFALEPALRVLDDPSEPGSPRREATLSALNGVYGDYLERTGNTLAIPMTFRIADKGVAGEDVPPTLPPPSQQALARALPEATPDVLVLVHGLCLTDRWEVPGERRLGQRLREACGLTSLTLRYNTGRHISTNGRELALKLEALLASWPVPVASLTLVGHSMGGLVARSAGSYGSEAGHAWLPKLRRLVCLGSPHHGAPLEKGGNLLDTALRRSPYTDPIGVLGRMRSAGIKDLRHGALRDEDWQGRQPDERSGDGRTPVPLLPGVDTRFAAATLAREGTDPRLDLLGDGLVRTPSALGRHPDPQRRLSVPLERRHIFHEMGHLALIDSPIVHQKLEDWLR